MATAAEFLIEEERLDLAKNAALLGWTYTPKDAENFVLGMTARDGTIFHLWCQHDRYIAMPPAWHWFNPATNGRDRAGDIPRGGSFFHSNKVICAPWNRLAYSTIDPRGPHGNDWQLANWRENPKTGACLTLSAMALRIHRELNAPSFQGRMP